MGVEKVLPKIKVSFHPQRSCKERMYVKSSADVVDVLRSIWNPDTIQLFEEFKVIFLDRRNGVIGFRHLNRGGVSSVLVNTRLILHIALSCNCSGVILAHNHPSGLLDPSLQDDRLTKKISEACKLLDLRLLDHIILSSEKFYSYADEGSL